MLYLKMNPPLGSTEVTKVMDDTFQKCVQVKTDGRSCQANAITGSKFCFFHDPAKGEDRKRAQANGGKGNKSVALPFETPDIPLKTTGDVIALLGRTINEVRCGRIDPKIANAIGYLSGIFIKTQEQEGLEKKIRMLEEVTQGVPKAGDHSLLDVDPFSEKFVFEPL